MGCIYKITNTENDKIYIGQTTGHHLARFGRHITTAYTNPCNELHKDIARQGFQAFTIEELEADVEGGEKLNSREQYYIDKLEPEYNIYTLVHSISKERECEIVRLYKEGLTIEQISKEVRIGYINTMRVLHEHGYRTRNTINRDEVIKLYKGGKTSTEISEYMKASSSSITTILRENNIKIRGHKKSVLMKSKDHNIIKEFPSGRSAGRYIAKIRNREDLDNIAKHINSCCRGESVTAYGFVWEYKDID